MSFANILPSMEITRTGNLRTRTLWPIYFHQKPERSISETSWRNTTRRTRKTRISRTSSNIQREVRGVLDLSILRLYLESSDPAIKELNQKQAIFILGKTGAGKSTTINYLYGKRIFEITRSKWSTKQNTFL